MVKSLRSCERTLLISSLGIGLNLGPSRNNFRSVVFLIMFKSPVTICPVSIFLYSEEIQSHGGFLFESKVAMKFLVSVSLKKLFIIENL